MALGITRDSYFEWIQENTVFSTVLNKAVELSSPFLDSLNENIKIYIEPNSSEFKVSDGGYTIWSLESTGISFRKGSHREKVLYKMISRMNISVNSETKELYIYSDEKDLGRSIHDLTQAILSVSDLLWFNKKTVKSLFFEEVSDYFKQHTDKFDLFPDLEIQGKSKLSHHFDYLMTVKNRNKKLVRLINHLDQTQLERTLLSWEDTSQQRTSKYGESLSMVALINDKDKEISPRHKEAFEMYHIEPVGFSNKQEVVKSLSLIG